jgi:hypothetical protein
MQCPLDGTRTAIRKQRLPIARRIILTLTTLLLLVLAGLSIYGAFLGPEACAEFFVSNPLMVFWIVLGVLLAVSFLLFPTLVRNPGMAALHAGCLLVLLGGFWNSKPGHRLQRDWLGHDKKMEFYLNLFPDSPYAFEKEGFSIGLERFWIEFYPTEQGHWPATLWRLASPADPNSYQRVELVDLGDGWQAAPDGNVAFRIAESIIRRPGQTQPALVVADADSLRQVPAKQGQTVPLGDPNGLVRVMRIERNLVVPMGPMARAGVGLGEALELRVELPERPPYPAYALQPGPTMRMERSAVPGHLLFYLPPRPSEQFHTPAPPIYRVRLRDGDREYTDVVTAGTFDSEMTLSLAGLYETEHDWVQAGRPILSFDRPTSIKDYKSELVVRRDGQEIQRKVIEVNDPLAYGGYHFYQSSYDHRNYQYTVLAVVSDSGMWGVHAGFVLLTGGLIWQMWIVPGLRLRRKRRAA